ncbi:MAG: hypothetical protein ABJA66_00005 [Actinomycetota bacterium]
MQTALTARADNRAEPAADCRIRCRWAKSPEEILRFGARSVEIITNTDIES